MAKVIAESEISAIRAGVWRTETIKKSNLK